MISCLGLWCNPLSYTYAAVRVSFLVGRMCCAATGGFKPCPLAWLLAWLDVGGSTWVVIQTARIYVLFTRLRCHASNKQLAL